MKIAVVILNWNGVKLLEQFLPIVIQNSPEATVYVADNASTDDSILILKEKFPEVKIIINDKNYGFAKGYTVALENVEEEIYCLLNSDVEVTKNWLSPILSTFEKEIETSIIQPKILDYKNKEYFEYAGAAGGFIDKYGYPYCRGRIFDAIEKDSLQYEDEKEIFWASGACFFIRKSVFKELNGFDADFFAHQEEIDLCWRAFNLGYKTKYISQSVVYHIGGATLEVGNPKKTELNFRNSLLMLVKNLPENKIFSVIMTRMLLDGIAGIRLLLQGKWRHFLAILKAHYAFYMLFNKNYKKRNHIQKPNYYQQKSIVFNFYFKKIRKYQH